MNIRGLMELVILNIELDIGVMSATLVAMMAFMAMVTTVMTTPVVLHLTRGLADAQEPTASVVAVGR